MKQQPFGRYLLLDKVAAGGMAEVWRAKMTGQGDFQRIVAIKKILPHVCEDEEFITMFRDEANITVQLQHSNIGQVYEFDRIDDIYYIGMEYISGKDVKNVWQYQRSRKMTIPLELACYIVQKMADGLDYAHSKRDNFGNPLGIVHRDVSPQNCLVSWDGEVKVIDFGIAKAADKAGHTRAGTLKGKFAYMSPEQIRGRELDGRADVFALGVCMYELVTGTRAFQAESEFSLLEMVRNVELKPPTMVNSAIPPEVERIIFKALAKEREHRYQTAGELSRDIQRYLLSLERCPDRHTLGQFLRENFTVEYDKERLRLESYREIEWTAPSVSGAVAAAPGPATPAVPQKSAAELAVMAALAAEGQGAPRDDDSSAFASSSEGSYSGGQYRPDSPGELTSETPMRPAAVRESTQTGITQTAAPPASSSGGAMKWVAFALAAVLLVGGAAGAASYFLLRGKATIAVTVVNATDATVRLDGEVVGKATPSLTLASVPAGTHNVIIEKEGFEMFHRTVLLDAGKLLPLKAELVAASGRLQVVSEPSGAEIWLDGKDTGKTTPAKLSIPGGTLHAIELRKENYKTLKKGGVNVKANADMVVKEVLMPSKVSIKVVSSPSGAKVKYDGNDIGTTPTTFVIDADAPYPELTLSKPGCRAKTTVPFDRDKPQYKVEVRLKRCR